MSEEYFSKREACRAVLFLFDIRRDPKSEDLELFSFLKREKRVIGVITKADKIAPTKRGVEKKRVEKAFDSPFILTSVLEKLGKKELMKQLVDALQC